MDTWKPTVSVDPSWDDPILLTYGKKMFEPRIRQCPPKSRKVPHGIRWWDKSLLFIRDYYFITNYIWNLGCLYGMILASPVGTCYLSVVSGVDLWGSRGRQPMSHLPPPCEAYRHRRTAHRPALVGSRSVVEGKPVCLMDASWGICKQLVIICNTRAFIE